MVLFHCFSILSINSFQHRLSRSTVRPSCQSIHFNTDCLVPLFVHYDKERLSYSQCLSYLSVFYSHTSFKQTDRCSCSLSWCLYMYSLLCLIEMSTLYCIANVWYRARIRMLGSMLRQAGSNSQQDEIPALDHSRHQDDTDVLQSSLMAIRLSGSRFGNIVMFHYVSL